MTPRAARHAYRIARAAADVSPAAWTDMRRTLAVWRVLPNTMVSTRGLIAAYECVRALDRDRIRGAIVECGVWNGGCSALMALAADHDEVERDLHLFDSFAGLPQPAAEDGELVDAFRAWHPDADLATGDPMRLIPANACVSSLSEAEAIMERVAAPERVHFHCGWFEEAVPPAAEALGPIALLRLDGDLYHSTKVCLEHLYPLLVPGGFLVVDDYGCFEGCRTATDDYFSARGIEPDWTWIDRDICQFRLPPD